MRKKITLLLTALSVSFVMSAQTWQADLAKSSSVQSGRAFKSTDICLPNQSNVPPRHSDFHPLTETPVTQQPNGTLKDSLTWSSSGMFVQWDQLYTFNEDGMMGRVVIAPDSAFIFNPISMVGSQSWVGGPLVGDTLTIHTPQALIEKNGNMFYLARLIIAPSNDTYICDTTTMDLHFIWRNDSLIQIDGADYGLVDANGVWQGYSDMGVVANVIKQPHSTLPAGVKPQDYYMKYDAVGQKTYLPEYVAQDGNNVFVANPDNINGNMFFRGEIKGDSVVFDDGQYVGFDNTTGHHVYFRTAETINVDDGQGHTYEEYTFLNKPIKYRWNAGEGSMITDSTFFMNMGTHYYNPVTIYSQSELAKVVEKAATPLDPVITNFAPYSDWYGNGDIAFDIPTFDTDSNYLAPSKMYYHIYYGSNPDVPVTFSPELYKNLTEPMTDIPYDFTDNYNFYTGNPGHVIFYNEVVADSMGVQSFYTGGGEVHSSAKVWFNIIAAKIDKTSRASNVAAITYYDLKGCQVARPGKGLYIRRTRYEDGTVKSEKFINQ